MHVTDSFFLPWLRGSSTIRIFHQRNVSSIKTNAFHSQAFSDPCKEKLLTHDLGVSRSMLYRINNSEFVYTRDSRRLILTVVGD